MKINIKLVILFLLIISVNACKSDKSDQSDTDEQNLEIDETNTEKLTENKNKIDDENFIVKIDFSSSEEGLFQVLYNLQQDPSQWEKRYFKINKGEEVQTIEAKFDLNKFGSPKIVRLILGGEQPKQISLKKFQLSGDGNLIDISSDNFDEFVNVNEFVQLNKQNNTLTTFKVKDRHIPIIALSKKALDSLLY
ncbi:hypothetical protein [Olleya sp. UBA1516]|uniref:hypothetical protein n=1 Tax=Olleya sp. UBA1516 TaxID=1947013 RepID=UPI0025EC75FE|nr:hypothetical protein [Olleya sp. UBA1516]|tara:strand:- start:10294 stop:10872 length:579 start_codon:yes stop_codon:yes gene_type:complete